MTETFEVDASAEVIGGLIDATFPTVALVVTEAGVAASLIPLSETDVTVTACDLTAVIADTVIVFVLTGIGVSDLEF